MQRRELLATSGAMASLAMFSGHAFAQSTTGGKIIPWADQPPPVPPPASDVIGPNAVGGSQLLDHAKRQVLRHRSLQQAEDRCETWKLEVAGSVAKPRHLTLDGPEGSAPTESDHHHGMLRQQWLPVLSQ